MLRNWWRGAKHVYDQMMWNMQKEFKLVKRPVHFWLKQPSSRRLASGDRQFNHPSEHQFAKSALNKWHWTSFAPFTESLLWKSRNRFTQLVTLKSDAPSRRDEILKLNYVESRSDICRAIALGSIRVPETTDNILCNQRQISCFSTLEEIVFQMTRLQSPNDSHSQPSDTWMINESNNFRWNSKDCLRRTKIIVSPILTISRSKIRRVWTQINVGYSFAEEF